MAQVYGIGGLISVPPGAITGRGTPPASFKGQLGQQYFDTSVSPPAEYVYNGVTWASGGNALATTTTAGIVTLFDTDTFVGADDTTVPTSLTVKTYVDNTAIAGSPVSTETTAGIGQLATDAEAVAGTPSTGLLALFVTPSNLTPVFAAPPAIGGTTPAAATFTDLTTTGTVSVSSAAPITIDVTGAGNDLTLSSDAGRVIINGEEAAANAITLLSVAGGIDADAALQINIATSQNAADAIVINASAGGIDITAAGAATEDIDITNTAGSIRLVAGESAADSIVLSSTIGGIDILANGAAAGEDIDISTSASVNITSTENNAGAIIVQANGGTSERITLLSSQGTGVDSINLESTAGGLTIAVALASADAINLTASAGGVDIDGALQVNIASSQNAGDAIRIVASAGGIDVDAVGAAGEDISIVNTGGSLILQATESDVNAIVINASGAAGGINVDAGSSGVIIDTTGAISLDAAAASNFTATGAFDITIQSTAGSILLNAGEAVTDAINIDSTGGFDLNAALEINIDSSEAAVADAVRIVASAADGGIDIDSGTGGLTLDSTGAISIDGAAASNLAVSGAGIDLTLDSASGQLILTGGEAAANAVRIQADNAAGGIDIDSGSAGVIVDTTGAISLDSAAASNFTVTGAFDLTLNSTAGSMILTAGETAADSMVLTNTGMDIVIAGAAGRDFDLTNTGGSVNITATENVSDAIVINASGAASGMTLDCGTASLTIGTGIKHAVTSVATAATPYAVLGTDYFITTDTTGGILTITLPAVPGTGRTVVVYDGAGQAATGGNITIDGNGNNIAAAGTSAATKVINTAYESYILTFNGTIWCGQNIV
jgi:hypothetical protein